MTTALATALILGLLIGILLGLFGGGGSILAVPALVYGVGLPLAAAVPTSLLVVGISAATAVLPRLRQVQWRLAAVFGATGAVAAFGGAALNRHLRPSGRAARLRRAPGRRRRTDAPRQWRGRRLLRAARRRSELAQLPAQSRRCRNCGRLPLTGLFGVGGGFLIIPLSYSSSAYRWPPPSPPRS